ncbi:unnamed protein product [Didymodactylos carnosus]|uniref:Uncharacterized protein n=1 Tax=Didymodactylos carnosus TaxID=1234261 RepID=A0A813XAV6_9BILA|nr:unnamed protein product [Didymodactylos carnosus]CAF0864229.1 unnamed protein product [Didymodactylos carnosus]CAF3566209.1 unnamed protein product [Didymodactylos carnosus]CAF3651774.1 unnamed protein product [Didymodactylos carnosus]
MGCDNDATMDRNTIMSNITSILTDLKSATIARISTDVSPIEIYMLYIIGGFGVLTNLLTILSLLIIRTFRTKHSCFLFHHCLIGLTESILCIPFAMSYFMNKKNSLEKMIIPCDSLGHTHLACVTAQVLNIVAMVALEAYRFEDLVHQESATPLATTTVSAKTRQAEHQLYETRNHHHQQRKSSVFKSTISCSCLIFGIVIIWCSSIILHLGITWIGSEAKIYYHSVHYYCSFIITDVRGYVLYLMWIIITLCSLIITIRYIRKVYIEVKQKRKHDAPLLSLSIIKEGIDIANNALVLQQILQRITAYNFIIALFIISWFPLFIVTLCNTKFGIPQLLRIFLLIAWSNSSVSPLCYTLLIPKFGDQCLPCIKGDNRNQYDTMKSYYNRVGDRFHDLGLWEEHQREKQQQKQLKPQRHRLYRSKKRNVTTTSGEEECEMIELNRQPEKISTKKKQQQYSNRSSDKLMINNYRRPYIQRKFLNKLPTIASSSTPSSSPTFKRSILSDSSRTTTHQPQSSSSQQAQISGSSSASSSSSVSSLTDVTSQKHHNTKAESIRYDQPRRIHFEQQDYSRQNQQPHRKKRLIHFEEQQQEQQLKHTTNNNMLKRRTRTVFGVNQLQELENVFKLSHYPDSVLREKLRQVTGLSESKIQIWFQNRRAKWRKQNQLRHFGGLEDIVTTDFFVPAPKATFVRTTVDREHKNQNPHNLPNKFPMMTDNPIPIYSNDMLSPAHYLPNYLLYHVFQMINDIYPMSQ